MTPGIDIGKNAKYLIRRLFDNYITLVVATISPMSCFVRQQHIVFYFTRCYPRLFQTVKQSNPQRARLIEIFSR